MIMEIVMVGSLIEIKNHDLKSSESDCDDNVNENELTDEEIIQTKKK